MISVRRSSIGIILFVKMLSERELSPLPFSTPSSSSLIVRRATASSPGFPDLKKSACRLLRRGNTGHTNIEPNPSHNSSHCTNTFQLRVQHYGTRSCVQRHQSWLIQVDTYLPRERPRARGTQNAKVWKDVKMFKAWNNPQKWISSTISIHDMNKHAWKWWNFYLHNVRQLHFPIEAVECSPP